MIEKYRKKIPLLIRNALKGLSDKNRQEILVFLLEEGEKSFIEISKELQIPKSNLSHHIKALTRYGLVYNFYKEDEFDEKYSYYAVSKLGKKILKYLQNMVVQKESIDAKSDLDFKPIINYTYKIFKNSKKFEDLEENVEMLNILKNEFYKRNKKPDSTSLKSIESEMPEGYIKILDALIENSYFSNRSEVIQFAINMLWFVIKSFPQDESEITKSFKEII